MTVGERAEDVFYVTDLQHRPLNEQAAQQLKENLLQALGLPPQK
jgi:UTP:GlnB (protein PII) uridylyltransferase